MGGFSQRSVTGPEGLRPQSAHGKNDVLGRALQGFSRAYEPGGVYPGQKEASGNGCFLFDSLVLLCGTSLIRMDLASHEDGVEFQCFKTVRCVFL